MALGGVWFEASLLQYEVVHHEFIPLIRWDDLITHVGTN
jgi:hypothetical protein